MGRVYLGRPGLFRPGHTVSLAKGAVEGEMVCVVERWCVLSPVLEGFARAREPRARRGRAALSARMAVFGLCVVSHGCWREGMQFSHCMVGKGAVDGERDRMRCVLLSLLECFARAREPSARPANRAARQPCARVRAVRGLQLERGVQSWMAHARAVMCVVVRCMGGGCLRPSAHTLIVWMGQARLS